MGGFFWGGGGQRKGLGGVYWGELWVGAGGLYLGGGLTLLLGQAVGGQAAGGQRAARVGAAQQQGGVRRGGAPPHPRAPPH